MYWPLNELGNITVFTCAPCKIVPIEGVGPEDLKIAELVGRVRNKGDELQEIIIATNPNLEGEATAIILLASFKRE